MFNHNQSLTDPSGVSSATLEICTKLFWVDHENAEWLERLQRNLGVFQFNPVKMRDDHTAVEGLKQAQDQHLLHCKIVEPTGLTKEMSLQRDSLKTRLTTRESGCEDDITWQIEQHSVTENLLLREATFAHLHSFAHYLLISHFPSQLRSCQVPRWLWCVVKRGEA